MSAADLIDPNESMWDWLAYDLRVYRLKHDQTLQYVGDVLNRTKGWVSNVENGRRRLTEVEARKLDQLWNASGHFLRLITYAKRGHDPDWGRQHLEHESKASVLMIFELALIPGLLQTEDYARASFTAAGVPNVEDQVARRMARQQELFRPDPPTLWVLLDEGVLDRVIGSPQVMKDQLAKLLEMSELPHVSIRIVPRSAGWHFGLEGAFKIMTGPAGDVVYTEACGGGRLVSDPEEVRDYRLRHARIGEWALPVDSSRRLIERKLEELE